MGELVLLYGLAYLAFVGVSLVVRGGHNPLAAAAHAIAALMGPTPCNFKYIWAPLSHASSHITVTEGSLLVKVS